MMREPNAKLVEILSRALKQIEEYPQHEADLDDVAFTKSVLGALQARLSREPADPPEDWAQYADALNAADPDADLKDPDLVRARDEWGAAYARLYSERTGGCALDERRFDRAANEGVRNAAGLLAAVLKGNVAPKRLVEALKECTRDANIRAETLACVLPVKASSTAKP